MGWTAFDEVYLTELLSAASYNIRNSLVAWSESRMLTLLLLCSSLYVLYYVMCVVKKPLVYGGGAKWRRHLLAHCPTLTGYYSPTIWAVNYHFTTVARFFLQRDIDISYERTVLPLSDGGEVGLDWGRRDRGQPSLERDAPILLVLPGLTGVELDRYLKYVIEDGICCGYRPVAFIQRGTAGLQLKTTKIYSATNIDDLEHAVNWLRSSFPLSDIVAVGVSLGGMAVTQYLHKCGKESGIKAAMVISSPWDLHMTCHSLEDHFFNRNIYNRSILNSTKQLFMSNAKSLGEDIVSQLPINPDLIMKSTTYSELNERLVCPLAGYRCLGDFLTEASTCDKVEEIVTPFICLTAHDDPFVPPESVPLKDFINNPHTLLVTTSSGGHYGFIEGLLPTSKSWMNRVLREVLTAMKDYKT